MKMRHPLASFFLLSGLTLVCSIVAEPAGYSETLSQTSVPQMPPPAPPNIISCIGNGVTTGAGQYRQFSAAECGGVLPDANYVGAMSILQINGGNAGFSVLPPSPPVIWFYSYASGAGYRVGTVYFHK